ncbi:major histocompatibility complex class I-related gene protein-like isoform X1 [Ctenopharyngodon idella]|uniref:major histocompatibility complex class I-related gene protein-like isoform X1 n=2 Tax=Ctenopharyngodon idella TaxID=7959 RepID=UPI00222EB73C|nr:major histocompatibility complex class I-related gene protein-like isoform X1 [Ctenopharyngodon idella]
MSNYCPNSNHLYRSSIQFVSRMGKVLLLFLLLLPGASTKGSHSLWVLATYIKGQTPFPEFSYVMMLDDVSVLYYDGETKTQFPRGSATIEDNVLDSDVVLTISDFIHAHFLERWAIAKKYLNETDRTVALQRLVVCELRDDGEPGQMITREAVRGSTTDELLYVDKKFTYQGNLNVSAQLLNFHLEISKRRHEILYQPNCIKTLKGYLEKRRNQVNRKVKPRVRLIQKANSDSGRFRVSCLATGFYPRHINLTLFRDGQPVSDQEITGGDLLPNGDGTYQMRKSLEISADEHKYTCSATHLSLENKLDVTLEFDPGEPFKSVIPSVLIVLVLLLVFGTGVVIYKYRKKQRTASSKSDYSAASTSEESLETTSMPVKQMSETSLN